MILYANGQQMIYTKGRLYERRLSSEEVCILLKNVERVGYFDYDSNIYRQHFAQQPRRGLVGVYYLSVRAWKSNEMVLPGVYSRALDPDKIQPELRQPAEVYQQFMKYDLSTFELYEPKQLAIYVAKQSQPVEPNFPTVDWKPSLPTLSSLEQRLKIAQSQNHVDEIIVSGDEAQAIATMFDNDPWSGLKFFKDGNEEYGVAIRALLPYETTGGNVNKMAQIPSPEAHYSSVELSCPN